MSDEPTERRRRDADPARPLDETAGGPGGDRRRAVTADAAPGAVVDPADTGATAPRPLSRRELRELERRRADAAGHAGGPDAVRTAEPAGPVPAPPDRPDAVPSDPGVGLAQTVPSDTSRYALVHYVVLVLAACVLGYLIWSLATGAADSDASVGPAASLTSPSALAAATQGEL